MTNVVNFIHEVKDKKIIKIIDGEPVEFVAVQIADLRDHLLLAGDIAPDRSSPAGAIFPFTRPET